MRKSLKRNLLYWFNELNQGNALYKITTGFNI